ncbi:MAG: ASPIC/UnbV domain-containing protein [Acidobacteriaceae bacterium]|nr:ASPIC/UnbV domain-containing protein [Acidobacteriaceae bacterium]
MNFSFEYRAEASENQRRLHFGVGPSTRVNRVEIHWPSGRV